LRGIKKDKNDSIADEMISISLLLPPSAPFGPEFFFSVNGRVAPFVELQHLLSF